MDRCVKKEEGGEDELELCIVCSSSKVEVNCVQNKDQLLSANLNVIFLLRKVLQVPAIQLEENLWECGDPVNWIRLCEQCSQLTRQAEELQWKIVRTKAELRSVQQIILDKTKATVSSSVSVVDKKAERKGSRKEIWRKTKAFISTCDYKQVNLINPFIEGDKLANCLDSTKHVIKVEVDHLVEEDVDWEPPLSPEVDELEQDVRKCSRKRGKFTQKIAKRKSKLVLKRPGKCICHLCGKTLGSPGVLKRHLVRLHKEDPLAKQLTEGGFGVWRCKVPGCSKKYTKEAGLDEHVNKMHGGKDDQSKAEMSYFCAFCGKGFYVEESLERHEKSIHGDSEGKKRFNCQFCGFQTAFKSYLDGHIRRVHKPSKKFGGEVKGDQVVICKVCGLQFWKADKLEKHKIIHDKEAEQPHPCDLCGRAYSTHESMWKHKRKIHKIYRRPEDTRIKK